MSTTWWRTDAVTWSAHGWSLQLRGDELAEIRYGDRMLVRAVRAAVRDRGWLTVPATVSDVEIEASTLVLHLRHDGLGAQIGSRLTVRADASELVISWDAENGPAFDTCRTGLVVLHPASDAGAAATVVHSDGSSERTAFPAAISPHQPIMDIRELDIDGGPTLTFEGDVFEMEDQRNWTDASFKTYSRPLALPYPYRLDAGERVCQSITVRPPEVAAGPEVASDSTISLGEAGPFPAVGIEASTAPDPIARSDAGAFRVVELNLTTPNWLAALERAAGDGVPLDVRLVTDGDERVLAEALRAVSRMGLSGVADPAAGDAAPGPGVLRVTAFDAVEHVSDPDVVTALRGAMRDAGLAVPVLGGARSHFTELNREQGRIARDVDGITLNTTPLFHTLDTEQLVEALPIQRLIAEQAVEIADGLPVHIGPVSLRPRFNNVATTPEPAPSRADLSEGYGAQFTGASDLRQRAPELAAWLVASAAALAVPGVASLSWFETSGPRGIAGTPAAEVLDAFASLSGGTLLSGASPDGLLWAIGARTDVGDVVLVANVGEDVRQVTVRIAGQADQTLELGGGAWGRLDT